MKRQSKLQAENAALREQVWELRIAKLRVENTALKLIIHRLLPKVARGNYVKNLLVDDTLIPGEKGPGAR